LGNLVVGEVNIKSVPFTLGHR